MTDFNPTSSVDINAIEDKMRMASLDQHRGYAQNTFGEVQQHRNNEPMPKSEATGYQVLKEPLWNKGELTTKLHDSSIPCPRASVCLAYPSTYTPE